MKLTSQAKRLKISTWSCQNQRRTTLGLPEQEITSPLLLLMTTAAYLNLLVQPLINHLIDKYPFPFIREHHDAVKNI